MSDKKEAKKEKARAIEILKEAIQKTKDSLKKEGNLMLENRLKSQEAKLKAIV